MLRFGDLGAYLDSMLIANATTINIPKTQEIIANNIFMRFVDNTLIDPYGAYEIFEDKFTEISGDLELIQTEGIKAVKQVDPNMVIKKKNGKDVEVQEGWRGHILPFDLVQEICLSEIKRDLKEKQEKLAEIPSSYEEILESMSEDDKEIISEALNDTNDAFVFKNIKAVVKSLKADGESKELIESLEKVEKLNNEEKKLKTEIKQGEDELHLKTKTKIESLSEEEVKNLSLMSQDEDVVEDGDNGEYLEYHCPSCGANIVTDETTVATTCYYCKNPIVMSGKLERSQLPTKVIPFKVDRTRALESFENWMKTKKFVPRSFFNDKKKIEENALLAQRGNQLLVEQLVLLLN